MDNRPAGQLAKRPLHFIWLLDCSSSMRGRKIEALNTALRAWIRQLQDVADENPQVQLLVRAISFSDSARWHVSEPSDIHELAWRDMSAGGARAMGQALCEVAKALDLKNLPQRAMVHVLALVSDGHPTDDFEGGLESLMAQPWGRKAMRIAIGIGDDADMDTLKRFSGIGGPEFTPLRVTNVAAGLVAYFTAVAMLIREDIADMGDPVEYRGSMTDRIEAHLEPRWSLSRAAADMTSDHSGQTRPTRHDVVRHRLVELVARYGRELALDAQRSKNLLRDFCPWNEHKPAIAALAAAAMENVPAELMRTSVDVPIKAVVRRLSKRLYDDRGLDERLARWAVETWALSMGLISADQLRVLECSLGNHGDDPSRTDYVPLPAPPPRSVADDIF